MTVKDHEKSKKLSEKGTEKYLGGDFCSWKTEKVVQIFSLPVKAVYWMLGEYEENSLQKVSRLTHSITSPGATPGDSTLGHRSLLV